MRCPYCDHQASFLFSARDVNYRRDATRFPYYRCDGCGLVFLSPIPADLSAHYPRAYYAEHQSVEALAVAAAHEAYKLALVTRWVRGGRLFEIGPASGHFCFLAQRAGFQVAAAEYDERACRFLREVIGIDATRTDDPDAVLRAAQPFDVIALWHSLEHLPRPWLTVAAAAARLTDVGILVVAVPNPESIQFRVLGPRWAHLDAPRHLYLTPLRWLDEVAGRAGLERIDQETTDEGGVYWNRFGWEQTLATLTTHKTLRRALSRAGRAVATAMDGWERRALHGSAFTAIYRRSAS